MNFDKIVTELSRVNADYTAKRGEAPIEFKVEISASGMVFHTHFEGEIEAENMRHFSAQTPEEFFAKIDTYIEELVSKEDSDAQKFREQLAAVIDFGREIGIEENIMAPVIELAKSISENAITDQSE